MFEMANAAIARRYEIVAEGKAGGATYTPRPLADFVAHEIVEAAGDLSQLQSPIRVLDPGVGDGVLLLSLLEAIVQRWPRLEIQISGFETDEVALRTATARIKEHFPDVATDFALRNFLEYVLDHFTDDINGSLFRITPPPKPYDLIIANPPYVRTQIMGAEQAQVLARRFGLAGRVDLYYAFIVGMAWALRPRGIAGIIVSNRFMTTKSGASVRQAALDRFNLLHVWDLGDTKLFDAAVLPAVLLAEGKNGHRKDPPLFTSVYETTEPAHTQTDSPIETLAKEGVVQVSDGRRFIVQHGTLNTNGAFQAVWRIATTTVDSWLETVAANTWGTFRDIGKIRVGVKTCADNIFMRSDWGEVPDSGLPELLRPVTTHHVGRRFKPQNVKTPKQILYPHEVVDGCRRAVDLSKYPLSRVYLERHRGDLEARSYVLEAGRQWYEIWVPQDPAAWALPKLVFRDIAQEPMFWLDLEGSVVNGDCYWIVAENPISEALLWLAAAVGNSTFIERFYDYRFHNKLYAGRRRYITQYVEEFPLPSPESAQGKALISLVRQIYARIPSEEAQSLQNDLDRMVWQAFGLCLEEIAR